MGKQLKYNPKNHDKGKTYTVRFTQSLIVSEVLVDAVTRSDPNAIPITLRSDHPSSESIELGIHAL